jgi:hypothetical protein
MLILGERHPRSVLAEYPVHYNTARPYQGIAQRVPDGERLIVADLDRERIIRKPVLGGLINEYARRLTSRRTAGHETDPYFRAGQARPHRQIPAAVLIFLACLTGCVGGIYGIGGGSILSPF